MSQCVRTNCTTCQSGQYFLLNTAKENNDKYDNQEEREKVRIRWKGERRGRRGCKSKNLKQLTT